MYAQSIVEQRITEAEKGLGFSLEYHSPTQIDEFSAHLKPWERSTDGGRIYLSRDLAPWEARWMQNELTLSICDAAYWMTRYAYIRADNGVIQRFTFRTAQRIYFEIISDLEARGAAIELICLKARQLGVSTVTELLDAHRVFFYYGVNAIIASADQQKSGLMVGMIFLAYDMMPWWMKPEHTRRVESAQPQFVFGSTKSGISVQHGKQTSGIARGTTPTLYHLSEVSSYSDPTDQIEASILRAVHPSPNIFGVLESTAAGDTGWFPEKYWYSKEAWVKGRARFCPLFLPWFVAREMYPKPTFLVTHPIPERWEPAIQTREHAARAELYVSSTAFLAKHLGKDWRMPLEQQWFWEVGYTEALRTGTEGTWAAEMPGDDQEAFQHSFVSVFGHETIAEVDRRREKQYLVYGLAGQSIESHFEPHPDDIDYKAPRISLPHRNPKGETFHWELIPIRCGKGWTEEGTNEVEEIDPSEKLFVFHEPQPGVDYSVGIDCSNGIGRDSTVISVCAVGKTGMPDTQVAEFRSPRVGHVEAFAFAAPILLYYSKYLKDELYRTPLVAAEQIAAVGDTCQSQLRRMGFNRHHHFTRYDGKEIDKAGAKKWGWYTTPWSRPILIGNFVHCVKNGWYILNSPWTLQECRTFEIHYTAGGKERMEHSLSGHDDGIFASAISTFIAHDVEDVTSRTKRRYTLPDQRVLPPIDLGAYRVTTNPDNIPRRDERDLWYPGSDLRSYEN